MDFKTFKSLIISDHSRLNPIRGGMIRHMLFHPTFKLVFWFRFVSYLCSSRNFFLRIFGRLFYLRLKWHELRTGIQLPVGAKIAGGLVFPHYSCIVINGAATIGKNCTILQGVTIGGDENYDVPKIGDNCVFAAGAKVIGNVVIGNNVLIGAGAVVTKDIPDYAVAVGVPAKVISYDGKTKVKHYHICG